MEVEAVAYYRSRLPEKFGVPRQAGLADRLRGTVELVNPYACPEALRGLEGFSHIWLIWGFHLNEKNSSLTVRPPRLGGNVRVGVFASRSPFRPNGMGLSAVKIESVDSVKGIIEVSGADLADGTPVYDIKPYIAYADSIPDAAQGFCSKEWAKLEVNFGPGIKDRLEKKIDAAQIESLVQILSLDPRPQYQNDPERVYGLCFSGINVRFKVASSVLSVVEID